MVDRPVDNPKDLLGSKRLPLHLVPDTAIAHMATAFSEGALKYGAFNWRTAGVRSSIYISAAHRHLAKWFNGDEVDSDTGVNHLASALACLAILVDAQTCGKLIDDRPPEAPMQTLIADLTKVYNGLQAKFESKENK